MVAVPVFHVILRQSGPKFDPALPLEQQSGWDEHAAYMNSLVDAGHIVLGGPLPNGRVAHAMEADSEQELRALWARDPWHGSHLILESIEPWEIRLDSRAWANADGAGPTPDARGRTDPLTGRSRSCRSRRRRPAG